MDQALGLGATRGRPVTLSCWQAAGGCHQPRKGEKSQWDFIDEAAGGGGPPILKFNKEACYAKSGSDESFNDQEFVADVHAARGGYIKFGEKGQAPEKHLGSVFPKDEAPLRASLGNTDRDQWAKGRFGDRPEDPWTAVIEIPLKHRETGEELFVLRPIQNVARCRARFSHTGSGGAARIRPRHPAWRRQLQIQVRTNREAGAEYHRQGAVERHCERRTAVQ